jgi:hypothetical protein
MICFHQWFPVVTVTQLVKLLQKLTHQSHAFLSTEVAPLAFWQLHIFVHVKAGWWRALPLPSCNTRTNILIIYQGHYKII